MDADAFADFYERYRAQCIRAGVGPLSPERMQARIAEWLSLGLQWDTEPQEAISNGNGPEFRKH